MTEQSKTYYQEAINLAIEYIEANISESLNLDDIAQQVYISKYHFHRIFKAMTGEKIQRYIIRLRIENAAKLLITTDKAIGEIALESGFQTLEHFSRSFKQQKTISASEFRKTYQDSTAPYVTHQNEQAMQNEISTPEIKQVKDMTVAYIRHVGPYHEVGPVWKRLMKFVFKKFLFGFKMKTIGVTHDNPEVTEEENIRYDACVVVRKEFKPEGEVGCKTLQGGKYAVFTHMGPYEKLSSTYDQIFSSWLPGSGKKLANKPCFEHYFNSPENTKPEKLKTDIYIPIGV